MQRMKSIFTHCLMAASLLNLTACSIISGYFPDKERDYQLSSELPPLKIPADITAKGLTKSAGHKQLEDSETVAVIGEVVKAAPANAGATTTPVEITKEEHPEEETKVDLVKFSNGETRMQINRPVAMSWRMIGKALSRKGLEITSRDQANGEFTVQYDPNETDFQDETFWDELVFVFGKDHSQEKPYHLKLLARSKIATETVVLDEQGKPLVEGGGLSLLKLLTATLKAEAAEENSKSKAKE